MSNYTLEQKALAFLKGELWWRKPKSQNHIDSQWSSVRGDISGVAEESDLERERFEYHIGPTPPKELTETELELVEMLERLLAFNDMVRGKGTERACIEVEAAALIKKTRGAA